MIRSARFFAVAIIGALLVAQEEVATSATVNFGAATEFVDSSDFAPLTHVIYAVNGGGSGDNQTVNIGGTPVLFESVLDTMNATTVGADSYSGAAGELYTMATDQASLDEILNSHHYIDGDGVTFSITLQNLTIGQNYRLQVIAPADSRECCNGRTHNVTSFDGGTAGTLHRFADLDTDAVFHTTSVIGNFTADATEQEFVFGGGVDGGGLSGFLLSSDMPLQVVEPQLTIDRSTGNIVLENMNAFAGATIRGYSLLSAGGAFDDGEWLPVANNYDLSSGGEVDSNDNWTIAAGNATELSEFNFASPGTTGTPGDAAPLAPSQQINLGNA